MLLLRYHCPDCENIWFDIYECAVDADCSECGKAFTPDEADPEDAFKTTPSDTKTESAFPELSDEDKEDYIQRARDRYEEEGTLEIDDEPEVSNSENGAYVQAWVWVDATDEEMQCGCDCGCDEEKMYRDDGVCEQCYENGCDGTLSAEKDRANSERVK